MTMSTSPDTVGRIWMPAPYQSEPMGTGSIQGVWIFPGQKVEWHWVHLPDGKSYVNGHGIENLILKVLPKKED